MAKRRRRTGDRRSARRIAPGAGKRSIAKKAKSRAEKSPGGALLIVLARDASGLRGALEVLIDLGISATVIEAHPLSTILRKEVPLFSGLASLLPETPDGRLVLCLTSIDEAERAADLLAEMRRAEHGLIIAVLPVARMLQ